jgi:hypothetical protein
MLEVDVWPSNGMQCVLSTKSSHGIAVNSMLKWIVPRSVDIDWTLKVTGTPVLPLNRFDDGWRHLCQGYGSAYISICIYIAAPVILVNPGNTLWDACAAIVRGSG